MSSSEDSWSGELAIDIAGLETVGLGKIHLVKLEETQPKTVRVCPECGDVPKRVKLPPQYKCENCNKEYNTWHSLKQAIPVDKSKGLVIPSRSTVKTEKALLSKIDLKKTVFLVTKKEYAIICLDEKAKGNMQKIGAMVKEFKKAVTFELIFSKGGVRHLFYIAVSDDSSMRAREIVPVNKVKTFPKEIEIYVEDAKLSGAELKRLMDSLPEKNPKDLIIETEMDKLEKEIASSTPEIEEIIKKMKEE